MPATELSLEAIMFAFYSLQEPSTASTAAADLNAAPDWFPKCPVVFALEWLGQIRRTGGFVLTGKRETDAQPSFAYWAGVCSPKKRDAESNAQALGLATQERSVIRRANGVSVGIEATRRR